MSHQRSLRSSKTDHQLNNFFRIILQDTLEDKKLRLPAMFVKNYGYELSDLATVIVPNGRVWYLELTRETNEILFDNGWPDFIEHYSITYGYFLVFSYKGMSCFHVEIFDTTSFEILYERNEGRSNEQASHGQKNPTSKLISFTEENLPDPYTPATASKNLETQHVEVIDLTMEADEPNGEELIEKCGERKASNASVAVKQTKHDQASSQSSRASDGSNNLKSRDDSFTVEAKVGTNQNARKGKHKKERILVKPYKLAFASPESRRAVQEAEKLDTQNPCFMVLLSEHDMIKYKVYVPTKFAKKYLRGAGDRIEVQGSYGRQWPLRFTHNKGKYASYHMNAGWGEFASENHLKGGDVLVFEVLDREDATLKVTIFRA